MGRRLFTPEADGLSNGDVPQFAILFEGNIILINVSPEFTRFETNGIFFINNTDLPSKIIHHAIRTNGY